MDTWGVVFLGTIALAGVVQAAFLVAMAIAVIRLTQRIDDLQDRLDHLVAPALESLDRVGRNMAEMSDLATVQARRIDLMLTDTIEKVEDTLTVAQRLVARPLRPFSHFLALLRGVQAGVEAFRQLGREDRRGTPPEGRRHGEDDEHLFI
jgi:hypothetical protein